VREEGKVMRGRKSFCFTLESNKKASIKSEMKGKKEVSLFLV
jgi:hypothetical protein